MIGLLWLDIDPKKSFNDKVLDAAERYKSKFGVMPNVCYVHPTMVDSFNVKEIRILPDKYTLKYHFLVGIQTA